MAFVKALLLCSLFGVYEFLRSLCEVVLQPSGSQTGTFVIISNTVIDSENRNVGVNISKESDINQTNGKNVPLKIFKNSHSKETSLQKQMRKVILCH